MAKANRVPRTIDDLIAALDDHQYLLRDSLYSLDTDPAHLKTLATQLRTLICLSTGTEGLLWRVADELSVSDEIELQVGESANRDHPLNRALEVWCLPLHRPEQGLPGPPAQRIRLREVIKKCEAIYVSQISDRVFTHELLIGAIAGQIGAAHEAEGIDHNLVKLNRVLVNHRQLYFGVLAFDAELTLQIGERVLDHAEGTRHFRRATRPRDIGDVSLCFRLAKLDTLVTRIPVVTVTSDVSEIEIQCSAGQTTVFLAFRKRGVVVAEFSLPTPALWESGADGLFTLVYSSAHRQVRLIINDQAIRPPEACDLGWIDARELQPELHTGHNALVVLRCLPIYQRLLSPKECGELLGVSADAKELRVPRQRTGIFPD